MSLLGALSTSSLAMLAQSQGLQTVSTNIANVNTTGYKREDTLFQTLLNGTKDSVSARDSGGTKYFGVKSVDRRAVIAQGLIQSTNRADDLAINGDGFFITSKNFTGTNKLNDVSFTRDGALQQRYVDTGNGSQQSYYVTGSGQYLLGWQADANGQFTTSDSLSGLVPLRSYSLDEIDGTATTQAMMAANVPSNTVTGDSVMLQGTIYDNSYNAQTLNYTWTKTGANAWTVDFGVTGGTVTAPAAGTQAATFNGNGQLETPQGTVSVNVTWDDGTTGTVAVDLTQMQQYADAKVVYRTQQDGNASGRLYSETFDDNGVLWGNYTNGRARPLYKLAIARFTAPDSLEAVSGNLFRATDGAGALSIRDLENADEETSIMAGSLESSNVDMGDEFTRMMMVQKAYSSAATTFRTIDQMIDEAASMKR